MSYGRLELLPDIIQRDYTARGLTNADVADMRFRDSPTCSVSIKLTSGATERWVYVNGSGWQKS